MEKTAGADQIVNEFMKYGGEGMLTMLVMLYNWIYIYGNTSTPPGGGDKE